MRRKVIDERFDVRNKNANWKLRRENKMRKLIEMKRKTQAKTNEWNRRINLKYFNGGSWIWQIPVKNWSHKENVLDQSSQYFHKMVAIN